MEMHISLVDRPDLSAEIYRQLRRRSSMAACDPEIVSLPRASWLGD
jgi:hypothetical protein